MARTRGLIESGDMESNRKIWDLTRDLREVLRECWDAQEVVMQLAPLFPHNLSETDVHNLAQAAIIAQRTNAKRNILIRQIDGVLGEAGRSQLDKTYG